MARLDHQCFRQPENKKLRLWRYMDFTKFVFLISSKKLFFCRSDLLGDPFEGSYSQANIALRPLFYEQIPKNILSDISNYAKWLREWTYINCWHANEYESAAMWKLYAQSSEAVAIETDYQTLADALPENVYLGLVNYIDYDTQWLPEGTTYFPFTHKRKSFEHEREVRAVVQEGVIQTGLKNSLSGIEIDIDVSMLVKCVHVSPTSPDWFYTLVDVTAKQFGFIFQVRKSNLAAEPVF
jgi:hypothetical protein